MLEIITIFTYALTLGLLHAFEADHVAAVATLQDNSKGLKHTSRLGMMWGFGHTTTLLIVGTILLVFGNTIPQNISTSLEGVVGIMLVVLGISVFLRVRKERMHIHEHEHDGDRHAHIHSHKNSEAHHHEHKSFIVGLVHGLAGSGALLLVVLATAESFVQGLLFILVFGLGSIFGMTLVSLLIGYFLSRLDKFKKAQQIVQITAGSISSFVGFLLIFENFFV